MTSKAKLAEAVIGEIHKDMVLGIGTGTTMDHLIDLLPSISLPSKIVSSSERTTRRLLHKGIEVTSFNEAGPLDLYIDGADEVNTNLVAIKGKGGALTLEKVLAYNASLCIGLITKDKLVDTFSVSLPVEVLKEARSSVARKLVGMHAKPVLRSGETEHGNLILDVYQLNYADPDRLEDQLKVIPGVVESGLFSKRRFDKVYIAEGGIIEVIESNE